ncbi:MAG: polymer-forming cytoskeletal protein [Dechloromonas sp.]|nr:polymer-forming cytoskeletal protein [Dechloromonas sp.]
MFGRKSENRPLGSIDSLIGAGTRIEGSVCFTGGLRVDGEVKGSILAADGASSSVLVLSEHARVEGAVSVAHLVTNGSIVGPVAVSQTLEMQSKARIVGDVEYAAIEMQQGAVIEGRLLYLAGKPTELKLASSA